jgi:hypothetical protein
VGTYTNPAYGDLPNAGAGVDTFRGLLGAGFVGEPLHDPDEARARAFLGSIEPATHGQPLVVLWTGHGTVAPDGAFQLLAADSGAGPMDGLSLREVAGRAAESAAGQLLIVLDTCFSGQGVPSATDVATSVMAARRPDSKHVWVGVLASCLPTETAIEGVFGEQLRRLLKDGPTTPHQRRRWSVHNEFVQGEDLGAALVAEWNSEVQQPVFRRDGSGWWMFPNPLFDAGAPEVVVEHLLLAARGGAVDEAYSWFTGRRAEVNTVVDWVVSGLPGLRVVTGSAGTGKSAIAGRVVSLANPQERKRLASQGEWRHADPGARSVSAHVHARGRTVDQVAEWLDGQLVRAGVLVPDESGRRNAAQLIGSLQKAIASAGGPLPVLVIDGLDEARGQAFTIARDLLTRLAPYAVIVVATRDLPAPEDDPSRTLIGALDPIEMLNLDAEQWVDSGRAALADYVVARLIGVDQRMDSLAIAEHMQRAASDGGEFPFLLARLVTDQLRANPLDTSVVGWQVRVADTMDMAFDQDLAKVPPPSHRILPADGSPIRFARQLLSALTWAFGSGFPDAEWTAVAAALSSTEAGPADIDWVLDHLGRYVVQDGERGVAVYRMAHQGLADRLRSFTAAPDQMFDPAAPLVARALLGRYHNLLAAGVPATQHSYLWYHGWRHAAAAGGPGLDLVRSLAEQSPDLRVDVALTAIDQASTLRRWGRLAEALPPTEEAVGLYRDLAADNPAFLPELAEALTNLGAGFSELGRRAEGLPPTEEAVGLYRDLVVVNSAFLPDLAGALNSLGNRFSDLGRRAEALPPTEEAVSLYRRQAADNPAFLPDLAWALNSLASRLSELGRHAEALSLVEEAVDQYHQLAADNPAFLPELAKALTNLGAGFSELGRRAEGLPPTEQAVDLYRDLVVVNPAFLPDLAWTLNSLGNRFADLGRRAEALPPTEEAVDLYRDLARDNAAFLPYFAGALTNLATRLSKLGRRAEALPPTEEAVDLYRDLAGDNSAFLPDLARALANLGITFSGLGRRAEGLPPTEEAVGLYRDLAGDNPAFLPDLARALNNLSNRLSELGRRGAARRTTEEAVGLYRDLSADNPALLPGLAMALTNLSGLFAELHLHAEALSPAEEAVSLYRRQAADNPAFLPDLAWALNSLATRLSELSRHAEALPLVEEAVSLYRQQAAGNPAFLPYLAWALNSLGNRLLELGRRAEGLPSTEQAVDLFRDLAALNAAFLPDLARALTNLGLTYSGLGRPAEALPPTEEAVGLYRDLVADNPVLLSDLATALSNLGSRYADLHQPGGNAAWDAALAALTPEARSLLLIYRSRLADTGDPGAATWLAAALDCATEGSAVVKTIRDEIRRHRADDPNFDLTWAAVTFQPLAGWADIDPDRLAIAHDWVHTPTYEDEHDYLTAHSELLEPSFDSAVEDVLLTLPAAAADRFRRLRETARRDGVTAAYRPMLQRILATEFVAASPAIQRELLHQRLADLLDNSVTEVIDQLASDQHAGARRAQALLALAAKPDQAELLDQVLTTLDEPTGFSDLLRSTARESARHSDPGSLIAVAQCAISTATSPVAAATAAIYFAIAAGLAGMADAATGWIDRARDWDPNPFTRDSWISILAELGQPQVSSLIPRLLTPRSSDPDQPAEHSHDTEGRA